MYSLTHSIALRELFFKQAPILLVSFLIAEMFYKFHSFTLEAIAFLATWYVLEATIKFMSDFLKSRFWT